MWAKTLLNCIIYNQEGIDVALFYYNIHFFLLYVWDHKYIVVTSSIFEPVFGGLGANPLFKPMCLQTNYLCCVCVQALCKGESNEKLKRVLSRNLLNTNGTQWLHFSVLFLTATCRPLFKPWVSLLKLKRQSSCSSKFYRTFKVFIWLSLVFEPVCRSSLFVWSEAVWGSYEEFTVSVRPADFRTDYLRHLI